jgi:predicted lactoylglutathione lyase
MIGYLMLGTNDLENSANFYDELLKGIGAVRTIENDQFIFWSNGEGHPMLSITKPYDNNPATVGNGTMVALEVENREFVHALHAKALELGASNEGDPGVRSEIYTAYFRDPDGNKLNFYCFA